MLEIIKKSKEVCDLHEVSIFVNAAASDFVTSTLTTGLSTAATIATGGLASSILSGTAAFTNATESEIDENFYDNNLASSIIKAIEAKRENIDDELREKRQFSYDRYNMRKAIVDAVEYHQQCSFYQGVVTLAEAVDRIPTTDLEKKSKINSLKSQTGELSETLAGLNEPGDESRKIQTNKFILEKERQINELEEQLDGEGK